MFIPARFLKSKELAQLTAMKEANQEETPQFLDDDLAMEALSRLSRRITLAIDEGLVDEPCKVGAAAGALVAMAASLCQDGEAAQTYAMGWEEYDCEELEHFLEGEKGVKHG